ncbi:recombinase family protein [Arthrobacter sp. zg-Y769]|uniref:recombinase family protein n=1 Tax=Arthrobacter sp. zg-Y769 TaxID=2894191 RepID=UPI002F40C35C
MVWVKIGYARVSTNEQDLTAQRDGLAVLGVDPENIYVDHGLTGTNRTRPGLREAMAAVRSGDTVGSTGRKRQGQGRHQATLTYFTAPRKHRPVRLPRAAAAARR